MNLIQNRTKVSSSVGRAVFTKADNYQVLRLFCQPFFNDCIERIRLVALKTLNFYHKNLLSRAAARNQSMRGAGANQIQLNNFYCKWKLPCSRLLRGWHAE